MVIFDEHDFQSNMLPSKTGLTSSVEDVHDVVELVQLQLHLPVQVDGRKDELHFFRLDSGIDEPGDDSSLISGDVSGAIITPTAPRQRFRTKG